MITQGHSVRPEHIQLKILRQNGPGDSSYWEFHHVPYEAGMNVISALQRVAAQAKTIDGKDVAPVAWECNCLEEVCGSCTMVINGRVRQACSALVDRLLDDHPNEIELRPMSKFPVVRDLVVERKRMFQALSRVKAWNPVDTYYDMGPGPRQSRNDQEQNYPLSQCMTCGCCVEACPQYMKVEVERKPNESDAEFEKREAEANENAFIGPQAISQVMLFNSNPTGKMIADERLEELTNPGGLQVCGNAQNCVAVCPKEIPLTRSIGRAGRAVTLYSLKKWFDR